MFESVSLFYNFIRNGCQVELTLLRLCLTLHLKIQQIPQQALEIASLALTLISH